MRLRKERQHSSDVVGNDTSEIIEVSCDVHASNVVPPVLGFRTFSLGTSIVHTLALEASTSDIVIFGVNTTFETIISSMSVVSTNDAFMVNKFEQRTFGTIASHATSKTVFHGFEVKAEHVYSIST